MNNTDYVSLETAKILKKAGYDRDSCNYYRIDRDNYYNNNMIGWTGLKHPYNSYYYEQVNIIAAPMLYEAQKWLREVHKIHAQATVRGLEGHFIWIIYNHKNFKIIQTPDNVLLDTYEQALDEAIREACKILKK